MMQMLSAGGMSVVTDGERQADADNPRGYFEWERIKLLPQAAGLHRGSRRQSGESDFATSFRATRRA